MFHIFRMLLAPDQVHFLPGPEFQVRHNYITFNVWLCFRFQKFEQKKKRQKGKVREGFAIFAKYLENRSDRRKETQGTGEIKIIE